MPEYQEHERPTAGERLRHWLVVTSLTLLGLLVAELPILSHTRDRVYLWLQKRLIRSHKMVVVVAIDDEEFWRGEPNGVRPLDRKYLATLLSTIATADPAVIGLDVGLGTNTPAVRPQWHMLTRSERRLLKTMDEVARRCPLVLPRTISGTQTFCRRYDLYDAIDFSDGTAVTQGHTSSARDPRQIPTRTVLQDAEILDSFAIAVVRTVMHDMPAKLEDPHGPWPYSFFLPNSTFAPKGAPVGSDGLLTARTVRTVTTAQLRKWLKGQVVLIGGTWHVDPDGGAFLDTHHTPVGDLPGVVVQANYVQSLLWDAMYALPRLWRVSLEVILALAMSFVFALAHGWRRFILIAGTLLGVVFLTWVSNAAIGVFFDMVVPLLFLGVHALWEGGSEQLRLEFRTKFRYADHVFTSAAIFAVLLTGYFFLRHEQHALDQELATGHRLQVTEATPASQPTLVPAVEERRYAHALPPEPVPIPRAPSTDERKDQLDPSPRRQADDSRPQEQMIPPEIHPLPLDDRKQNQLADVTPPPSSEHSASDDPPVIALPETPQSRIRLIDVREARQWLSNRSRLDTITVSINHGTQGNTDTKPVLFAEPQGACGAALTDVLMAEIQKTGATVIDPMSLEQVMSENRMNFSGQIDSKTAAKLRTLVGSGTLFFVKVHDCKNFRRIEQRETADAKGNVTSKRVPVLHGTLRASIQTIDLATGAMSARTIEATASSEPRQSISERILNGVARAIPSPPADSEFGSEEELQEQLITNAAAQAYRQFFPWNEHKTLVFFTDDQCRLRAAFDQLRQGDVAAAAREAQASVDLCTNMTDAKPATVARAYYNRAVTSALAGEEIAAYSDLIEAWRLEPNKVVSDAMEIWPPADLQENVRRATTAASTGAPVGATTVAKASKAAASKSSREARLRRLEESHSKGLITKEEYERRRQEILKDDQ